ncbi:MAG: phosphate signaling complex protein PhoU [Desulfarculaceae bacterium]|nr:phosphate signaling complex protein PhoU [Desulfarculaceae bacterium]
MDKPHTLKVFDAELEALSKAINRMMDLAGSQVESAVKALVEGDPELATATVERDAKVNQLQGAVDGCTLRLLALRQPVAKDLRQILTAGRLAADLERVADYASHVARYSLEIGGRHLEEFFKLVAQMGSIAGQMLAQVQRAYQEDDAAAAVEAWKRDREIDRLYADAYEGLSRYMASEPECVEPCLALVHTVRAMERIGDHITNLAEQVYFQITGKVYP